MSGIASTTEASGNQINVACVGDSITYGHGITGWPNNTYPAVLQDLLGKNYHVNNYGVSSFAVQINADRSYRSLAHYQESLDYDADFVIFMMGSNDSKPENWVDAATFKADLLSLLGSYEDAQIILCTPAAAFYLDGRTDGVANHDIQPQIVSQIAEICREVSLENGYPLLDIHALTAEHPKWFVKDGIHPSNEGAAAIAQAAFESMQKK